MKVDRKNIRISQTKKHPDGVAELKKADAHSFVWELTEEIYLLSGKFDVKSRQHFKDKRVIILFFSSPYGWRIFCDSHTCYKVHLKWFSYAVFRPLCSVP